MPSLNISIKPQTAKKKILVEMDADKFESLAGSLGFFSADFLKSLNRAEKDYRERKFKRIESLKQLKKI